MTQNIVIGLAMAFWILGVISLVLAKLIHEQLIRWANSGSHATQRKSLERIRPGDLGSIVRLFPSPEGLPEGRGNIAGWFRFNEGLIASRPFLEKGAQLGLFDSRLARGTERIRVNLRPE